MRYKVYSLIIVIHIALIRYRKCIDFYRRNNSYMLASGMQVKLVIKLADQYNVSLPALSDSLSGDVSVVLASVIIYLQEGIPVTNIIDPCNQIRLKKQLLNYSGHYFPDTICGPNCYTSTACDVAPTSVSFSCVNLFLFYWYLYKIEKTMRL